MKSPRLIALACVLPASLALAGPMNPSRVPAAAKWVVHVDAQAYMGSKLHTTLVENLPAAAQNEILEKLAVVESLGDIDAKKDIYDVTLFGTTLDDTSSVVLIHGVVREDKLMPLLKAGKKVLLEPHNSHQIFSWGGEKGQEFGCFYAGDTGVYSKSRAGMQAALDVLDGKGKSLADGTGLLAGPAAGTMLHVAVADLTGAELDHENEFMSKIKSGVLTVRDGESGIAATASAVTDSEETASQLASIANGGVALLQLAAGQADMEPEAKLAIRALRGARVSATGKQVDGALNLPYTLIAEMARTAKVDVDFESEEKNEPAEPGEKSDSDTNVKVHVKVAPTTKPAN